MVIFFTRSASHLTPLLPMPQGDLKIGQFSDGEISIHIGSLDPTQEVTIIASTPSPAENLLELYLLLNALTRLGVSRINLILLYFGYARQAQAAPGYANGAQLICQQLRQFNLAKIEIIHAHDPETLASWLPYTHTIPFDFFMSIAPAYDIIVAPDSGAAALAQQVAQAYNKETLLLHKIRNNEHVSLTLPAINLNNKKLLIVDDILATGATLSQAAKLLADQGANQIDAAVTHGIFSGNAEQLLAVSPIRNIFVTNTLAQQKRDNVIVYDIAPSIRLLRNHSG